MPLLLTVVEQVLRSSKHSLASNILLTLPGSRPDQYPVLVLPESRYVVGGNCCSVFKSTWLDGEFWHVHKPDFKRFVIRC